MIRLNEDGDYSRLQEVLDAAYQAAARGKGRERHASGGAPFEDQPICEITRRCPGFALGQAVKKAYESQRLPKEAAKHELIGAINYLAAQWIIRDEEEQK